MGSVIRGTIKVSDVDEKPAVLTERVLGDVIVTGVETNFIDS